MRIGDARKELSEKGTTVLAGGISMKTTFCGFSLMPPENQASVGHPPRRARLVGNGFVNERTGRSEEL
jgi:hypothetical protein